MHCHAEASCPSLPRNLQWPPCQDDFQSLGPCEYEMLADGGGTWTPGSLDPTWL